MADPIVTQDLIDEFVVSLSASVTAAAVYARRTKEKDIRGLKEMIQERMGQKIHLDPMRIEECVLLIEEVLKPFDIDPDKARKIVKILVATANKARNRNTLQSHETG
jgi:hypothetical protein